MARLLIKSSGTKMSYCQVMGMFNSSSKCL